MDLVTITDHDQISGVLTIADRDDVIVGCEITATFPDDGVQCHIGVLGINEEQHREVQKLRRSAPELVRYLKDQGVFTTLNHLASLTAGRMKASHILSLLPWLDALETRNGTRLRSQNRTATALAQAHEKVGVAGSDSHTYRGIGRTYVVCDTARNRDEFLLELRQGRGRVEGHEGSFFMLAADIVRLTANFYFDGLAKLVENPMSWRRQLMVLCSTLGLPLTTLALVAAYIHCIEDERYNNELLVDLVARQLHRLTSPSPVRVLTPALQDRSA
jgi:hypothetical protein